MFNKVLHEQRDSLRMKIYVPSTDAERVMAEASKRMDSSPVFLVLLLLVAYKSNAMPTFSTGHTTDGNIIHTRLTHTFNGPFSGTTQVSRYQKGKNQSGFY